MNLDLDQLIRGAVESATDRRGQTSGLAQRPVPQVSLLPSEIRSAGRLRRMRGVLVGVVAVAALLVVAAVALSAVFANEADARRAAAQSRLSATTQRVAEFRDVQTLERRVALGTAAVRVGGSTAIDWQRWSELLLASMPAGYAVTSVQADSATPYASYTQGDSPLEHPRAATVQITAQAPSLDQLPVWLRELKALPAYSDLSVSVADSGTGHTVAVTVHLTTAAYVTPLKGR